MVCKYTVSVPKYIVLAIKYVVLVIKYVVLVNKYTNRLLNKLSATYIYMIKFMGGCYAQIRL